MTGPRRLLLVVAGVVAAVLVLAAAGFGILDRAPRGSSEGLFSIEKGQSLSQISRQLQAQGFIRFAPLLQLVARLRGTERQFKAGYFRIPAGASTIAIHDLLVEGAQTLGKVTIPEGWTIRKIARHLEAEGITPAADFLAAASSPSLMEEFGIKEPTLEGYLFPDTYFVPRPFPAPMMVRLMARTFFENLSRVEPGWKDLDPAVLRERIIMASIVEREYQIDEEAPTIASVFYNRLRLNIGLESCATLEYIITEIQQKPHPEYITIEDEKIDSPYNTYKWAGLPPAPISSPGLVALEAAFKPARTDYYYFVLRDPNGGRHFFSRDLTEHNQAKYLYLKKP
jgi:UPF0755 protein